MDNGNGSMEALHQSNDEIQKKQSLIPVHTAMSLGATNKEKPPAFSLRSNTHSNLALSSEIERNKMPVTSNGFTFLSQLFLVPNRRLLQRLQWHLHLDYLLRSSLQQF